VSVVVRRTIVYFMCHVRNVPTVLQILCAIVLFSSIESALILHCLSEFCFLTRSSGSRALFSDSYCSSQAHSAGSQDHSAGPQDHPTGSGAFSNSVIDCFLLCSALPVAPARGVEQQTRRRRRATDVATRGNGDFRSPFQKLRCSR